MDSPAVDATSVGSQVGSQTADDPKDDPSDTVVYAAIHKTPTEEPAPMDEAQPSVANGDKKDVSTELGQLARSLDHLSTRFGQFLDSQSRTPSIAGSGSIYMVGDKHHVAKNVSIRGKISSELQSRAVVAA